MPEPAEQSILDTTKKALGIESDYTAFDPELIMHVNSVFADLFQLGVGPQTAYAIEDKNNTWGEFLGSRDDINSVKSYIFLRVRLLWDPPNTSFNLTSLERQADELLWRLNIQSEGAVQNG